MEREWSAEILVRRLGRGNPRSGQECLHAGPAPASTPNAPKQRLERRLEVGFGRNEWQRTAGNGPHQKPAASQRSGASSRRANTSNLSLTERSERRL